MNNIYIGENSQGNPVFMWSDDTTYLKKRNINEVLAVVENKVVGLELVKFFSTKGRNVSSSYVKVMLVFPDGSKYEHTLETKEFHNLLIASEIVLESDGEVVSSKVDLRFIPVGVTCQLVTLSKYNEYTRNFVDEDTVLDSRKESRKLIKETGSLLYQLVDDNRLYIYGFDFYGASLNHQSETLLSTPKKKPFVFEFRTDTHKEQGLLRDIDLCNSLDFEFNDKLFVLNNVSNIYAKDINAIADGIFKGTVNKLVDSDEEYFNNFIDTFSLDMFEKALTTNINSVIMLGNYSNISLLATHKKDKETFETYHNNSQQNISKLGKIFFYLNPMKYYSKMNHENNYYKIRVGRKNSRGYSYFIV